MSDTVNNNENKPAAEKQAAARTESAEQTANVPQAPVNTAVKNAPVQAAVKKMLIKRLML